MVASYSASYYNLFNAYIHEKSQHQCLANIVYNHNIFLKYEIQITGGETFTWVQSLLIYLLSGI